jgi:hypothetical protein
MYVAQFNISKEREPLDHPVMKDFVEHLAPVNALADEWAGFVWRLCDDSGNATAIRIYEDKTIIFNLSVWASIETLKEFVYRSGHADVLRKRRTWFEPMREQSYVLWWVAEAERPSVAKAKHRLRHLQENGCSAYGFTFDQVHYLDQASE